MSLFLIMETFKYIILVTESGTEKNKIYQDL